MIRPATIHDVPRIQAIINSHAELGRMLFKSYAQLYEDLRDFAVFENVDLSSAPGTWSGGGFTSGRFYFLAAQTDKTEISIYEIVDIDVDREIFVNANGDGLD